MSRILLADDEKDFRSAVAEALQAFGHDVTQCGETDGALNALKKSAFDVVLADLRMPGQGGLEILRQASARLPDCALIIMTAHGSMDVAIEAMKLGVHDFLSKPVNLEALVRKIETLVKHQRVSAENRLLRRTVEENVSPRGLVGESEGIKQVLRLIRKVGPTDTTVLITGETGSGKEVVARGVHQESPRREDPFVPVNCGSIAETLLESELFGHVKGAFTGADRDKRGLFEVAGKGTIFLDEIGEMPLTLQPKLLRVLEEREIMRVGSTTPIRFQARILAATHRNLKKMADEGKFRSDLLYRLNVFEIPVPPLRERPGDIGPIAEHLLTRVCARMNRPPLRLAPEAARLLERYPWPGNVRELAKALDRGVIVAEEAQINPSDLSGLVSGPLPPMDDDLKKARLHFEREHVQRVIRKYGGDKKKAAEAMGVDLSSLYRKLQGEEGTPA